MHRSEFATARSLIADSRAALDEGTDGVTAHPDVRFAGYLLDAEKEYAEANLAYALVSGEDLPAPACCGSTRREASR